MNRLRLILSTIALTGSGLFAAAPVHSQQPDACVSTDGRRSDNEVWTTNSWTLFNRADHRGAIANANACMANWSEAATQMQATMTTCPPTGSAGPEQQAATHKNGVLNDVAINYWILGRSYQALGDRAAARTAYESCARFRCARTWDPKGWFWDPAADCAIRQKQVN